MGGRLLTIEEAKKLMGEKILYPNENQWAAVTRSDMGERDWV